MACGVYPLLHQSLHFNYVAFNVSDLHMYCCYKLGLVAPVAPPMTREMCKKAYILICFLHHLSGYHQSEPTSRIWCTMKCTSPIIKLLLNWVDFTEWEKIQRTELFINTSCLIVYSGSFIVILLLNPVGLTLTEWAKCEKPDFLKICCHYATQSWLLHCILHQRSVWS